VSILLSPFSIQRFLPLQSATKSAISCNEKCAKALENDGEEVCEEREVGGRFD
jgi:hypothetical protein